MSFSANINKITQRDVKIELARKRFIRFVQYTFPAYQTNWHHKYIADKLDDFVDGKITRLMILCPPRHGKSELVSRRLPAYIFGKYPNAEIISASYGDSLAKRMNRDVQRVIDSELYMDVFPDVRLFGTNIRTLARGHYLRNSDIFEIVGFNGSYRSCGVGGGITGMGMNFGIIDDPIKNAAQAASKAYRESVWEWYQSTLYTRLERIPGGTAGGILLTLTPWHFDDIAGRLLQTEKDKWTVIKFPAIKDSNANPDDPREYGGALWSEKKNLEELEYTKTLLGSYYFSALYQCDPKPEGGMIVDVRWFSRYDTPPSDMRIVQSWDTAHKASQLNDYSVCTTWGISGEKKYLLDVYRERLEYPDLKKNCLNMYKKYNPNTILIEDKGSGISLIQDLKSFMPVIPINPCGDKIFRMSSESAQIESGLVYLPNSAAWLIDYESEISGFPNTDHDDQVDSTSQALTYVKNSVMKFEFKSTGVRRIDATY